MRQRIIQIARLRTRMVFPVQIVNPKPHGKRLHLFPVPVVAKVNMYLALIRVLHARTAAKRLIQQIDRLAVCRDKYIHIGKFFRRYIFRERIVLHRIHICIVDKSLYHAQNLYHQQGNTRNNRYNSLAKRDRKEGSPHQIHNGKKHIQEEPYLPFPVTKDGFYIFSECVLPPAHT